MTLADLDPAADGQPHQTLLDIVYPVKPGDNNAELRYSLRTVEVNYPHADIWIVGHKPGWLKGVNFIPGNDHPHPAAIYHNILAACRHPDVPDRFVVFNDDFYVTEPVTEIPVLYRGRLLDHLKLPRVRSHYNSWWAKSLHTTKIVLQALGYVDPLSYELHAPLPVDKEAMRDTLERFAHVEPDNPPQWRTLYGNLHNIGGVEHRDCKAFKRGDVHVPFHSTDDNSWRYFAAYFSANFPDPSQYEVLGAHAG